MKKRKTKLLFLIFIGVYTILFINVHAETTLPYNGTAHNIGYSIESFKVQIYDESILKVNLLSEQINVQPLKEVDIPGNEITINPKEELFNTTEETKTYPNIFGVKLNIENGQALFEKYVRSQLTDISTSDKFFCIFVIQYKLTSVPEQYKYLYHLGWENINQGLSIFLTGKLPTYSVNTSIKQTFNSATYTKSTDSFNYNEKMEYKEGNSKISVEANGLDTALSEYCLISEQEYNMSNEIGPKYNNFIFYDLDNLKSAVLKYTKDIDNNDSSLWMIDDNDKNEDINQNQTVKTPDTKANNINKIIIGISILLLGSIIILIVLRKKRTIKEI